MKISCACEYSFEIEHNEKIDLDKEPEKVIDIQEGNFLAFICPQCGKNIKSEIKTRLEWKSKKQILLLVPERNRIACLNFCAGFKQIDITTNKEIKTPFLKKDETPVIGYSELLDRINVLHSNLIPAAVEAVKFFVMDSAKNININKIQMVFQKITYDDFLEFYIYGMRENEIGIMKIPIQLYDQVVSDMETGKNSEVFKGIYLGQYLSYKNIQTEEK